MEKLIEHESAQTVLQRGIFIEKNNVRQNILSVHCDYVAGNRLLITFTTNNQ